jgi:hypothetical protein
MTATVAVLNASYEELGSTHLGRALALVMRGDAVIDESDPDRIVRHASGSFPWPLVIRLLRFVKVKFRVGEQHWSLQGVRKRDNFTCGYCGKSATTVDHILPQSRGGRDTWMNTVAACQTCNGRKANQTPAEAGMTLWITPYAPTRIFRNTK